jgi:hypothetical protein
MPGKHYYLAGGCFDMLDNVPLKQVIIHPEQLFPGKKLFLFKVIAITALQVTQRTCRLDKYLKLP